MKIKGFEIFVDPDSSQIDSRFYDEENIDKDTEKLKAAIKECIKIGIPPVVGDIIEIEQGENKDPVGYQITYRSISVSDTRKCISFGLLLDSRYQTNRM